ncbi:MAG: LysM peptidoglycan-binding domain-containing protein [Chloroflexi bacterium]|nr:LysM peptidoglycan-binding domain-containing protein [Chloroflexota bacterium]MCI0575435.1 LysM peptidoglycan-binding domain-containing protein [Chloroflexota bacterium]MCI0649883.1 LysM peptidoglycan-binding domain-containing protein [Chloroflexota bacterium]MCI0725653.1 LysM peptidoglycan-binding domain-containing protein [Chloroflexota bacterium]
MTTNLNQNKFSFLLALACCLGLAGCQRPDPQVTLVPSAAPLILPPTSVVQMPVSNNPILRPPTPVVPPTPLPAYAGTPTPDPTRLVALAAEGEYQTHYVQYGESLGYIAQLYGSTVEELMTINGLQNSDFLAIDQPLLVPAGATNVSPSFKIIPDSELVYGPAGGDFDVPAVVASFGGYLLFYQEEVEGELLSGSRIVELVAHRYSVNPRLLLALIEYRSGWLTQGTADNLYPLGYATSGYEGLYKQLNWAANLLNLGFYGRAEGGLTTFNVGDELHLAFAGDINDGTAGVQMLLSAHSGTTYAAWQEEAGPSGFFATFSRLFGNPFAYTRDPLWSPDLVQPPLALPWAAGETWYFTGGPHGGWAGGSAWAALDFAPAHEQLGCYTTDAWITSMSDGVVSRSDFGAVVVDLDGDGFAGTGWAITYMHLESRDRVAAGTVVRVGHALGHPSCEGGFSNGTHVHISRTYNGRWVAADGAIPFVMGGWLSQGLGREYDGLLVRGELVKEACECREEGNAITAE